MFTVIDEKCARWAFGYAWELFKVGELSAFDLMCAWNRMHGDKVILQETDTIEESMAVIREFYDEQEIEFLGSAYELQDLINDLDILMYHIDTALQLNKEIYTRLKNQQGLQMDKKMHEVTKKMETAGRDIKKGKVKKAAEVLKKAEKKNEKLVKIDKNVRDPKIEKCDKAMKKMPKAFKK